jgi:hypothetical protein
LGGGAQVVIGLKTAANKNVDKKTERCMIDLPGGNTSRSMFLQRACQIDTYAIALRNVVGTKKDVHDRRKKCGIRNSSLDRFSD